MPTQLRTALRTSARISSLLELADTTETLALLSLELSSPSWTMGTSFASTAAALFSLQLPFAALVSRGNH